MALATRDLLDLLRSEGDVTGGPRPFSRQDRSQFLQALDRIWPERNVRRDGLRANRRCLSPRVGVTSPGSHIRPMNHGVNVA